MQISNSIQARNSEEEFARGLRILADSGSGLIHVRTHEVLRAAIALRRIVLVEGDVYNEWDIQTGFKKFDVASMYDLGKAGDSVDPVRAMERPITDSRESSVRGAEDKMHYYVYLNPQYWLDNNPPMNHILQQAAFILPSTNVVVVMITPDMPLPEAIADLTVTLRFSPPGHSELLESVGAIVGGVDEGVLAPLTDEDKNRIGYAGAGMAKASFDTYVSLAIVESGMSKEDHVTADDIIAGINKGKTEIVNRNDLLELYPPESMDNVGGMDNLKTWVGKRAKCYSDEAKEYGIEPPKGMVFVGIPGTGKSLAAKAISRELGVPLIRLDFGRVFNALVGSSEQRIRTALAMVESMSPCVLFCDEIDKGLGGVGGTGDSGTSSRVLGTFLTWLQDNTAPVFTMVTANNIAGLPPELLRRGRFDAIFSSTLPDEHEREEVLKIHLRKRDWDPSEFDRKDILSVVNASGGYVPAEIEAAVKDGLIDAFTADEEFGMEHVVHALEVMEPLSKAYAAEITAIQAWAEAHATPASSKLAGKGDSSNVKSIGRRRTRTTPVKPKVH